MRRSENSSVSARELLFVLEALRSMYARDQRPTDREVETTVLNALKYAKDRAGGRQRRREARENRVAVVGDGAHHQSENDNAVVRPRRRSAKRLASPSPDSNSDNVSEASTSTV